MDDLIAKLEAAMEGNRKLDSDIQEALTGKGFSENDDWQAPWPHYTSDITDALTLVSELLYLTMGKFAINGVLKWRVKLWPPGPAPLLNEGWSGDHEKLALALCIAALKARNGS